MSSSQLDEVDRGILHLLQQDARNHTPVDMSKALPVSEGTVRNRIERMEERGVIEGYVPTINYEAAGFPLEVVFTCTASIEQQDELAEQAIETHRVIDVRKMLSSRGNVQVVAIATDLGDIVTVATELAEHGLDIENQRLTLGHRVRPFNHFGEDATSEETTDL